MEILKVSADGSTQFRTISAAIDFAQPHSRISVSNGIYNENIVINKPLEIIADDEREKVVIESFANPAVLVETDSALFRGFTVRGYLGDQNPHPFFQQAKFYGIYVTHGNSVIEDCDVWTDFKFSMAVVGKTAHPLIRKCKIHGQSNGIIFSQDSKGILEDSEIFDVPDLLLRLTNRADPIIKNCRLHHGKAGISTEAEAKGIIEDCQIFDIQGFAVYLTISNTTMRRCKVHDSERGIIFNKTNTVENCEVFRVKEYSPGRDLRPEDLKD